MSLETSLRKRIGHTFVPVTDPVLGEVRGFFRECTYAGGDCKDPAKWTVVNLPGYGNCYTFNTGLGNNTAKKTALTGNINGLKVELFLDQSNYMLQKLSKKGGVRIVVHDPKSMPMVDEFGMDLQPNTATSISVQQVIFTTISCPKYGSGTGSLDSRMTLPGCLIPTYQTALTIGSQVDSTSLFMLQSCQTIILL